MWQVLTAAEAYDELGFEDDAELVLYQSFPFGSVTIWPLHDGRYGVGESDGDFDCMSYREGIFTAEQVAARYGVTRNVLDALTASGC